VSDWLAWAVEASAGLVWAVEGRWPVRLRSQLSAVP